MTTTTPVWQKASGTVDQQVQRYMAGEDVLLDRHLLAYDIQATIAHVDGLARIDVIPAQEAASLIECLRTLSAEFESGRFVLDDRFEDGHSAIEWYLTEQLGDVGRKVHLGRSRNDQVLVAQRLFMRDMLGQIAEHVRASASTCLDIASTERDTPMPGYTHLQRAVPSSVGLWMAGIAEALIDDIELLNMTRAWINTNPLGTAAGYGVNVALDRIHTTTQLGFDRMQINPVYTQNSRGKHEMQVLSTCWQVLQDVRRLAWDVSLFSTAEFGFITMGDTVSTGSSIMPNKRNPDLAELLRGAVSIVTGCMSELQSMLSLPSGY